MSNNFEEFDPKIDYKELERVFRKELLILYNSLKVLDRDFRSYDVLFGLRKLHEDLIHYHFENEIIEDMRLTFLRHYEKKNRYIFDWLRNFIKWDRDIKNMYFREFKNKERKLTEKEIEEMKKRKKEIEEEIKRNKPKSYILDI